MCLDQMTDVLLVKPADTTHHYGLEVPRRTRNASNYCVDVLFTPTAPAPAPPAILSFSFERLSPSIPSTPPLETTVTTTSPSGPGASATAKAIEQVTIDATQ